ncbi:unnamed protein product, partial [Rotaria sp. Silwood1]
MIDTGATHSFITQRALSTLYHPAIPSCDCIAELGDGQTKVKILVNSIKLSPRESCTVQAKLELG